MDRNRMPLAFPLYYFPTVPWLCAAIRQSELSLDMEIAYRKQRFFSRTPILTSQGVLGLTVIIARRNTFAPFREKEVVYYENWVRQHLRSIEMAYRKAPFFEHFFPECEALLAAPPATLWELNLTTTQWLMGAFGWKGKWVNDSAPSGGEQQANAWHPHFDPGLQRMPPWYEPVAYRQLYGHFQAGLSGLDLLMNEGPAGRLLLLNSWKEPDWTQS